MLYYKIVNTILKIFILFCISGVIYIGYILIQNIYSFNEFKNHSSLPSSLNVIHDENQEFSVVLNDSTFEGVNKNLNMYTIKAKQAIKDLNNQYKLDDINVEYALGKEQLLTISALNGFLNDKTNILDLKNNVKFILQDAIFQTNDAKINLIKKDIISNSSVTLHYKNSHVTSSNFSTHDDNNLIIFNGNVCTTIDLSNF